MRAEIRYGVVGIVAVVACSSLFLAGASAQSGEGGPAAVGDAEPAIEVAVQPDGSAAVTVTYAFDLDEDARADAFEELRTNESAVAAFEERFRDRMATVAANAADATGREMRVEDADVALRTADGTGVVEASVTWHGLAAVDGDALVLTEPFASGYEADRHVVVVPPAGYEVAAVAPQPDGRSDGQLVWEPGTDLGGFEVRLAPSAGDGPADGGGETAGDATPGLGTVAALVGLTLGLASLARRR